LAIAFVGNQKNRFLDVSQPAGDGLIKGGYSVTGINDKHQYVGTLYSQLNLLFYFFVQLIDVIDPNATRVDNLEITVFFLQQKSHTVPRDSCHIVDNCQAAASQPVENAGFTHIGSTDN
jgi:hypothetical protein